MDHVVQFTADELASLNRGEVLRLWLNGVQEVVVLPAEQYDRLKQCIDATDADPKTLYPLIANVNPADWEDLAAYSNAEKLRRSLAAT